MRGPENRVNRFVDDILGGQRPRRFKATNEEAEAMRGALKLGVADVSAGLPDPDFVRRLEHRILTEAGEAPAPSARVTRRTLLTGAGTAAAAMLAGAVVEHRLAAAEAPTGSAELLTDGGVWRPVAAVNALPEGDAKRFSTGSIEGFVVNDGGSIRALSAVCTHQGCLLRPETAQRRLDCPCHRTAFSWSGRVLFSRLQSAPADLPMIRSRIQNGQVEVYVV
jgi:cytochrome b6-f complex iron-sulfur subunit